MLLRPSLRLALTLAPLLSACAPSSGGPTRALREGASPLAFDSTRGVTVLFGALDGARGGETWEYDGSVWTLRATTGPSPREGHALAFDSTRGVTVLFGGFEGANVLSRETWEWDGNAWVLRTSNGPTARYGHAMAFDSTRNTVLLFGGRARTEPTSPSLLNNEMWEYDGTTARWNQRGSTGPAARSRHALAYDSVRNLTVLFGGQDEGGEDGAFNAETWEWNGTTRRWTQLTVSGPSARTLHAMAFDSVRGVTLLFGGYRDGYHADTWAWDGTAWTQLADEEPSPRAAHALAYDSTRDRTVLFGGFDGSFPRDTWEWDGSAWAQREAQFVTPRAPGVLGRGFLLLEGAGQTSSLRIELRSDARAR